MISVASAMQQDNIIELLTHLEGEFTFTFKEKKGIKLYFETTATDLEAAAKYAKEQIKAQSWGSVLYMQVIPV